jgi:hypothetical protein
LRESQSKDFRVVDVDLFEERKGEAETAGFILEFPRFSG